MEMLQWLQMWKSHFFGAIVTVNGHWTVTSQELPILWRDCLHTLSLTHDTWAGLPLTPLECNHSPIPPPQSQESTTSLHSITATTYLFSIRKALISSKGLITRKIKKFWLYREKCKSTESGKMVWMKFFSIFK